MKATIVFDQLWEALHATNEDGTKRYRYIVLEGGSRSSKTTSIMQALFLIAHQQSNLRMTAFRFKRTWIEGTVWKDWCKFLVREGQYSITNQNLKELSYKLLHNNILEFAGLDDQQRLHGREQDYSWVNEAMECPKDDFDQLDIRTAIQIILDYNPSHMNHWIYDNILKRDNTFYIHSTLLDNPFLPQAQIDAIYSYEDTEYNRAQGTVDKYKWDVYGLGKKAKREGVIITNWEIGDFPGYLPFLFGQDYGSNDPTTLVKVAVDQNRRIIYAKECFYIYDPSEADILRLNTKHAGKYVIVADSQAKILIKGLKTDGLNMIPCIKGPGSIVDGIKIIKGYKLVVHPQSTNLVKELENYVWQDKQSELPIDDFNHLIDPIRYVMAYLKNAPGTPQVQHINR